MANVFGIEKNVISYLARLVFAITVTLSNKVPV